MDILRVLATPDLEVRKKTLSLILDLVSSRNIEDIVLVLKKVNIPEKLCFEKNKFPLTNLHVGGNQDAQHNRAWRYGKVSTTFGAHSSFMLHQVSWHFCDRHSCTNWIPFRHQRASSSRCIGLCSRSDSKVRRTSSINHRETFGSLSVDQVRFMICYFNLQL